MDKVRFLLGGLYHDSADVERPDPGIFTRGALFANLGGCQMPS